MNPGIISSYVRHKDRWFNVSTINRQSSAAAGYGHWYSETLVWEWNKELQSRGDLIFQDSGVAESVTKHTEICRALHETGEPPKEEE